MAPAPSLAELIQTVHDRSTDADALTRVTAAAEVTGEITNKADLLLGHFVAGARQAGCSWSEIGAALGVSKQGAQQRFVDRDDAMPVEDEHLLVQYTSRARAAVAGAREEALHMGHNYVGTEHLLLGILVDPEALSVKVLDALGVPPDDLRDAVVAASGPRSPDYGTAANAPLTPRARRVLDLTRGESLRLGHNYVGTEHLLLALVAEEEGIGGRVLRERGVDPERARAEVVRALSAYVPVKPR
ncbi:MAG TPA: Clp protease N-terminal domain-containing protein [Acidimicrobiia bacterium]|nr:Clp protease N-terminal domain-containing protein [Acidimicrobiia bacterium]